MSYASLFDEYLQATEAAHTHTGKLIAFSEFLKSVFGVSSYDIVPNVEQYIKVGGLITLRGRMDMRLGRTIIEFKVDLSRELDTAIEEIERYSKILKRKGQKVGHCIVTDGTKFKIFRIKDRAKETRSIDFTKVTHERAIGFLDTYLFSEKRVPTALDLNMRFGPGSLIFEEVTEQLSILFRTLKDPIKFELWSKNMQLIYGTTPPEEAFISQTYLMMLVRLLLARYLVKKNPPVQDSLNGKLFNSQGIRIIEEDFFSWILSPLFWTQFKPLVETISDGLESYDLEDVDEDIFKEIYQDIIKEADRHRIGEYYTPEWLAELTLDEAVATMDPNGKQKSFTILDPACGSGTFITNAITILRKKRCTLKRIMDSVCGIDLNPVAVVIARANYLLALGKLVEKRKGPISIPIYMADSIKFPKMRKELISGISILAVDVNEKTQLNLPLEIVRDEKKLERTLTTFSNILSEYHGKRITKDQALNIFAKTKLPKKLIPILTNTLTTIMDLMDSNQDSIWIFMMRNIYAPLRLREKKFHIVVGNPPWVSLRYIENPDYKSFIKRTAFKYNLLESRQTDLFTQMDTSTIFYVKAASTYLRKNGVLAFVMPRSVLTGAKQHKAFKKQAKPRMKLVKVLDLGTGSKKVEPLFNVDSCSLIAISDKSTSYPIPSTLISGTLPEKNIRLDKAKKYLAFTDAEYSPPTLDEKRSPYHGEALSGACIYPRTLWFIEFIPGEFAINPKEPLVKSLILPYAKHPWKSVIITGEVEAEFIFATMTGQSILPFKSRFLPIVLPIKRGQVSWQIQDARTLRNEGKFKMAQWMDKVQSAWQANATETSLKTFPDPMDYVNYHNKLLLQRHNIRYFVVYTASGTHIAATVVDPSKIPDFRVDKTEIPARGFVADYKTFWLGTNNLREAYYLAAILNSETINEKIKPYQPRGLFGPRDITRLPFEFSVPRFDPNNKLHMQISRLGQKATKEAEALPKMTRSRIKKAIPSMKMLNKLVLQLLT